MDSVKVLMVDDEARMRKLVKDFLAIRIQGDRSRGRGAGSGYLF